MAKGKEKKKQGEIICYTFTEDTSTEADFSHRNQVRLTNFKFVSADPC